jgi:hypothetical protein
MNQEEFRGRRPSNIDVLFAHLEEFHGISRELASKRLHRIKDEHGFPPDRDLLFDYSGGVFDPVSKEWLGSLTQGGKEGRKWKND